MAADVRLLRARGIAAAVRAWLATHHCLHGERFRLGPEGTDVVLVLDFAACPMNGYMDQGKYPEIVLPLFQILDKMELRLTRGSVFSEFYVYDKQQGEHQ